MLAHRIARACGEAGLRPPGSYGEGTARARLFAAVAQTLRSLGPEVYASRPDLLAASTGDGAGLGLRERRALRKQARSLPGARADLSREELCAALTEAAGPLAAWQGLRPDPGPPRPPAGLPGAQKPHAEGE